MTPSRVVPIALVVGVMCWGAVAGASRPDRGVGHDPIGAGELEIGEGDVDVHIPPAVGGPSGRSGPVSSWTVTPTGFTPSALTAVEYAAALWADLIESPVPIRVSATWCTTTCSGVASGGPSLTRDFAGAPLAGVWYPRTLADSLAGTDLNPGQKDITLTFNGTRSDWYYGVDGDTPSGKIDLVSVTMHELAHGLGFTGTLEGTPSVGSPDAGWGLSGYPTIFDVLSEDGTGRSILDSGLPNPGVALQDLLTGGDLWSRGPGVAEVTAGQGAELHAPTPETASSFSHLDETSYAPGADGSLMSPVINTSESIHDPGRVVLAILADLGYSVPPLEDGPTGFLRATTSPAQGARLFVNGTVRNDWGIDWASLPVGSHEVCFSDAVGFATPPCQVVDLLSGQTTGADGSYTPLGLLKVEVTPAGLPSTIYVDGAPRNEYGVFAFVEPGAHQVCWGEVDGYTAPACEDVTVVAGTTETANGTFTPGGPGGSPAPNLGVHGYLRVTTTPAVASRILVDGVWRSDWGVDWVKFPVGSHEVCFTDVVGYGTPPCQAVEVTAGATATVDGAFDALGLLKVQVSPAGVPTDVVVDGLHRNQFGSYAWMEPGSYDVCWSDVPGFTTPPCQTAVVTAGGLTTRTGVFVP